MIAEPVVETAGASASGRQSSILIRKAGVLGAGKMGSRIAAHFANAGRRDIQ